MVLYAKAENEYQDVAQKEFERRNSNLQTDIEIENLERIATATERLEKALEKLRLKGGNIYLDGESLRLLTNRLELKEKDRIRILLNKDVEEFEFSNDVHNFLRAADIKTISQLVIRTEEELLKFRNVDHKQIIEIITLLNKYGLHLGMEIDI